MAAHQRSGSSPISAYRYESASEGQYALEVHRVYFGFPGNTANSACRHRGRRAGSWNRYATKEIGRNIMRLAAWWRAALGTAKDGMDADFYSRFASRFFLWMRISADSGRSAVWAIAILCASRYMAMDSSEGGGGITVAGTATVACTADTAGTARSSL